MKKILPYLILLISLPVFSQVKIGENTGISNPSAALEFTSPNKGILLPAHSASIVPNAINGLLRFNPQQNRINYFSNYWRVISDSSEISLTNFVDLTNNADNDYFKIINEDNTAADVQSLRIISNENTVNHFNLDQLYSTPSVQNGSILTNSFPVSFSRTRINDDTEISKLDFNFPNTASPHSGNAKPLTITSAGHVGIWEDNPQATLHLSLKRVGNGDLPSNTFLFNPGTAGTGKVLRVTGPSGEAYWETYEASDFPIHPNNATVVQFSGLTNLLNSSGTRLNLINSHPDISSNTNGVTIANNTISFSDTKYEVYFMVRTGNAIGGADGTLSPFNIQLVPSDFSGSGTSDYGNALALSNIVYAKSVGSDVITTTANFFPEPDTDYKLLITGNNAAGTIPLNNVYAVFLKVY